MMIPKVGDIVKLGKQFNGFGRRVLDREGSIGKVVTVFDNGFGVDVPAHGRINVYARHGDEWFPHPASAPTLCTLGVDPGSEPANVSEWGFSAFVADIDVPRVLREARSDGRLLVEIKRGRADRITVTEWWVHRDLIKMHDAMPARTRPIVQFMILSGAEWGTTSDLKPWLVVLRDGPHKVPVKVRAWKP